MPVTNLKLPYRVLLALFRIAPLNRGVFRRHWINFLKKRVKHAIRANFRGVPFYFHLDNPTEQKGLFNYYNLSELDFLSKIVGSKAVTFVDVGANSGFYSQIMLYRAAPGAKVIAIEPNPAMCERIRKNISLIQDHIQARKHDFALENCAAGPEESTMHLDLDGGLGGAHIVDQATATSMQVKVDKLLNILHRHRVASVDALKIDVEGFEDRVLIPFFSEAKRSLYPGHIVIEHTSDKYWSEDLWGCLRQAGYKEVFRTRGNAVLRLENPEA